MALNLVQYDASDSEGDEEESGTCAVIVAPKQNLAVIGEISELPKPSQRELELAELAKKEKANLIRVAARKKDGKVLIAVPSLADVGVFRTGLFNFSGVLKCFLYLFFSLMMKMMMFPRLSVNL